MIDPENWSGKRQVSGPDWLSPSCLDRLDHLLDRDDRIALMGDVAFPLAHWLLFLPQDRQSKLAADGTGQRGGFLPVDTDLPQRMWAGSRLRFPGRLRAGMALERASEITSVRKKTGKSGRLLFVTVSHAISEGNGAPPLVVEEQDIVYRSSSGSAAGLPPAQLPTTDWRHELVPDERLLFRYSALTFNAHRIHYDLAYTAMAEGYPRLVVQGPLTATLMLDSLHRQMPDVRVLEFSFKAVSPLFAGNRLEILGRRTDADKVLLWTIDHEGRLAMSGEAIVGFGDSSDADPERPAKP